MPILCTATYTNLQYHLPVIAPYDFAADERRHEQWRREQAFILQFMPKLVPVVPQFHRLRIWQRPEFHARSCPRPAAMRPRKPTRREKEKTA